jgi:hypothetical protein
VVQKCVHESGQVCEVVVAGSLGHVQALAEGIDRQFPLPALGRQFEGGTVVDRPVQALRGL